MSSTLPVRYDMHINFEMKNNLRQYIDNADV